MGATENVGFSAKVQRNLGLGFVTKQHKSLQKQTSLQLSISDMLTHIVPAIRHPHDRHTAR